MTREKELECVISDLSAECREQRDEIASLKAQLAECKKFIKEVSEQTPEKPDYWSSCSQCERNISDAEDLIEA
jgi:septal ring factor EnvC (AmiA/AmiB activator)